MNFATGLARDADGNQTTEIDTTVAKLEDNAARTFNEQAVAIGIQFDFVYQDWSKLDALGKALQSHAPGLDLEFVFNGNHSAGDETDGGASRIIRHSCRRCMRWASMCPAGDGWPTDAHNYPRIAAMSTAIIPSAAIMRPTTYPSDPHLYPDQGTQTIWAGNGWWGISRRDSPNTPRP